MEKNIGPQRIISVVDEPPAPVARWKRRLNSGCLHRWYCATPHHLRMQRRYNVARWCHHEWKTWRKQMTLRDPRPIAEILGTQ